MDKWINREKSFNDNAEAELARLQRKFNLTLEDILAVTSLLYVKMGDGIHLTAALTVGLDDTRLKILQAINEFYNEIYNPSVTDYLIKTYQEGFKDAARIVPSSIKTVKVPYTDSSFIKQQINTRWAGDGKLYSDRIWTQKNLLFNAMDKTLNDGIIAGHDIKTMSKNLADNVNVAYSAADRLVRTETNFVVNQSGHDVLKALNVERYEYIAKLDKRTSSICEGLDGKVFLLSEKQTGVNYPPVHPNCRSTVAPVVTTVN